MMADKQTPNVYASAGVPGGGSGVEARETGTSRAPITFIECIARGKTPFVSLDFMLHNAILETLDRSAQRMTY